VPESARWPEATIDVPVGAIRACEFLADNPGDWPFHCHKAHHAMNAMGHNTRNFIGAAQKSDLVGAVRKLVPGYMPLGSSGMAMGEMAMPAPANTLPMVTGTGQFGPIEMGGMFTVIKIREGLSANDYKDPGPYDHPEGTVAYEFEDKAGETPRPNGQVETKKPAMQMQVTKPGTKAGHMGHH
jgi:manganese oxidase